MKNFKALLGLAAAVAVALLPGRSDAVCSGDPTGGGITGADTLRVLTCAANPGNALCATSCGGAGILDCADVNVDGSVNVQDAILIANQVGTLPGTCPLNVVPLCTSPGPVLACGSTISADITSNIRLSGCEYTLDGTVFVQPGTVVSIAAGATIKGKSVTTDGTPSALIFLQGDCAALGGDNMPGVGTDNQPDGTEPFSARINAAGTPSNPIVFTSDQPVGARASGDWAGVAFNGCAATNVTLAGFGDAEGLVGVTYGGGSNDIVDESSGYASYLRLEFAGRELSPNNELNVWTMNALGSCTTMDHIQAHAGADDGFEWFGGSINMRYIVATANRDDNLDWQMGTNGKVQFAVVQQTNLNIDTAGSNGFEGDNNENAATDATRVPFSDPRMCNVTLLGTQTAAAGTNRAFLLRRGTSGRMAKIISNCWKTRGMDVDGTLTAQHACSAPPAPFTLAWQTPLMGVAQPRLLVEASVFGDNDNSGTTTPADCGTTSPANGTQCVTSDFCTLIQSAAAYPNGLGTLDDGTTPLASRKNSSNAAISIPCTFGLLDPSPSNPADSANTFDCSASAGFDSSGFFVPTNYSGGVDPNNPTWLTEPWINFDLN